MATATSATAQPACIATGCPDVGVYVACLASYNNGILYGAWIDLEACQEVGDIQAGIDWILTTSPTPGAEEYAVHDTAGQPAYLSRTEWPTLSDLIEWAEGVSVYEDEDDREAYRLACEDQGETISDDHFRETYQGLHRSGKDYAQELAEDLGSIPDGCLAWPLNCIDWESAWRDLTFDGYSEESCSSGGVHIFRSV